MGLGSVHLPFIIAIDLLLGTDALAPLSCFTFDNLICSPEVMTRCNLLSEVVAANAANVDRVADAAEMVRTIGERPGASDGGGHVSIPDVGDDSLGEGASDDENSRTYYFGLSTITVGKIKEMVEKNFTEGEGRVPGAETVPEPDSDEAVVYEDFFVAGLRMPPHPTLADILLKFPTRLHQLMPNAIAQFSKYFWVVGSFGGMPEANTFAR
jgi:hypothetical protein